MKKKTSFLILSGLFVLLFFSGIHTQAQQVTITFLQPPPNQWRMEYMWNATIHNNSGSDQQVYLTGTVEEKTQGLIAHGDVKVFTARQGSFPLRLSELKPTTHIDNGRYKEIVRKTSTLPDGTYIVCITVHSPEGKVLSKDCFEQVIANMSPPELTYPPDKSSVKEALPVFQWMPPSPVPPGEIITYSIKIIELMDGQVPTEAMAANPFYFQEGIRSPYIQFPVKSRSFNSGKTYAWQVTAYGKNYEIGKSQVWSFSSILLEKLQLFFWTANCTDIPGKYEFKMTVKNSLNTVNSKFTGFSFSNKNPVPPTSTATISNIVITPNYPPPVPTTTIAIQPGNGLPSLFNFVNLVNNTIDLAPNNSITIEGTLQLNPPSNVNTIMVWLKNTGTVNGSLYEENGSSTVDFDICKCDDCEDMVVTFDNFNTTPYGNSGYQYNIAGNININMPIYDLECQVQSYKFAATPPTCSNGVTSIERSGMFLRPATSLNGTTSLEWFNETISGLSTSNNNAAKAVKISGTTPTTGAIPVNFTVGLPGPISGLPPDCCKMEYTVCVKVIVFYDAEKCKSCTFIHCFDFTNQ